MTDDASLLHRYAEDGSDEAFAELVRRHIDVVYATALRRTDGAAHLAADVTQQVFSELARNAHQLGRVSVLGAWLHTSTRNAAIDLMISEKRRRTRETEALALSSDRAEVAPDWDRVRPVLDAAIDELPEPDRTAIVLRYLERRSFATVGAILLVTEDAARMRTDRALDKLRAQLERRGVTSTAAALATAVAAQPLVSAPAGLAASVATQSLAMAGAGAVISKSTLFLTLMNTKIITAMAVVALGFFALGRLGAPTAVAPVAPAVAVTPVGDASRQLVALQQENAELRADLGRMTSEKDALLEKAAVPIAASVAEIPPITSLAPLPANSQAVDRIRLNNLRLIDKARDQFIQQNGRAPASLDELVGEGKLIPWLNVAAGEDYSKLSLAEGDVLVLAVPEGRTMLYAGDNVRPEAVEAGKKAMTAAVAAARLSPKTEEDLRVEDLVARVAPSYTAAAAAFQAATGKRATKPTDVIRYFGSIQEAADFMEAYQAREDLQTARRAGQ